MAELFVTDDGFMPCRYCGEETLAVIPATAVAVARIRAAIRIGSRTGWSAVADVRCEDCSGDRRRLMIAGLWNSALRDPPLNQASYFTLAFMTGFNRPARPNTSSEEETPLPERRRES